MCAWSVLVLLGQHINYCIYISIMLVHVCSVLPGIFMTVQVGRTIIILIIV